MLSSCRGPRSLPVLLIRILLASTMLCGSPVAWAHDGAKFEPPDGSVLHGAGQHWQESFDEYELALGSGGVKPYIAKRYTGIWDRYPKLWLEGTITWAQLEQHHFQPLRTWLAGQQGLMPELSINFELYQNIFGDMVIPTGVLDPVIVETARIVRDFGQPIFIRPGYEPAAFHYTPGQPYIDSYKRIVDIFRQEGVDNAAYIWCAGQAGGLNMASEGVWFPGDAYVDWIGIDLFSPESILPDPGSTLPYNPSLWTMLELAKRWRKPVILSETSAIIPGGITDNSPASAQAYWDQWFGPFFQLIHDNPRIKAFNYINWNWPTEGWPVWWDARISNNTTLAGMISTELSTPRYLHRDTPDKFRRPWFTELGSQVAEGGLVRVGLANADFPTPGPSYVKYFLSFWRNKLPGTPGYLDHTYGIHVPDLNQYWFLGNPTMSLPIAPVEADGTYELNFNVPAAMGFAGTTVYLQAVVLDPKGRLHTTQPHQLDILP